MTWSILFHERDSGRIAIAVATKFFAVGARVPFIEPLKGGLCTQALLNPLYGPDGLNLIRAGASAGQVVKTLTEADAGRAHRQLHVLGADGKFAAYTGAECVPWCGHTIEQDFSVDRGELTPTLKVKRRVIEKTYAALIDRLYAEGPEA